MTFENTLILIRVGKLFPEQKSFTLRELELDPIIRELLGGRSTRHTLVNLMRGKNKLICICGKDYHDNRALRYRLSKKGLRLVENSQAMVTKLDLHSRSGD